jgi:excinuclease ABC subunit C
VATIALAKRMEEVYVPGRPDPVVIPRSSEALYLLQQVRDEAHRFALDYHRTRRGKRMTQSALDGITGLGAARRRKLLKHFGSVKRIRRATIEELKGVPGIPAAVAEAVHAAMTDPASSQGRAAS